MHTVFTLYTYFMCCYVERGPTIIGSFVDVSRRLAEMFYHSYMALHFNNLLPLVLLFSL